MLALMHSVDMSAAPWTKDQAGEVSEKVLRRAEVAKMARALHNRLALASFKTKRGWETLDLDSIEPKVEVELQRKRPRSSDNSARSDGFVTYADMPQIMSSPMTPAIFSDQILGGASSPILRRTQSYQTSSRQSNPGYARRTHDGRHKRSLSNAAASMSSKKAWRGDPRQLHSSPLFARQSSRNLGNIPAISFNSDTSTIPDELPSPAFTNSGDENELPVHSFHAAVSHSDFPALPRTPPPTRSRGARFRKSANGAQSEEGADLLLYLATSPSPAIKGRTGGAAPSTPPMRNSALPSSMMETPGGTLNFGLGNPTTPGQLFDLADFVNVTPSPAQIAGRWGHSPLVKTPIAAKETRRRLNFDALAPPSGGSPSLNSLSPGLPPPKGGLSMKLGGEIMS